MPPLVYQPLSIITSSIKETVTANRSKHFASTTSGGIETTETTYYAPRPGEIIIVLCVVIGWIIAVVVFLKRWASIRISQPTESRYRNNPKNLENVKVVKRPQDSVIYKNYGRKLSVTIVEREKRILQRMHTIAALPSMEMGRVAEL